MSRMDKPGPPGDQDGFDEIIDAADDEQAVEHHEDGPAGLPLAVQPGGRTAPDQWRADRDHRQEEGGETEQHGRRHAGDQEADHRHRALRRCRANDTEHDAHHRATRLVEHVLAQFAAQLARADVKRVADRGPIAIEERK